MIKLNEEKMIDNQEKDFIVQFRNVTKIYSGTIALRKVNISIKRGEVHGIIGKNGAGKTTLVGIMSGIITPTEGEIFVKDMKYKMLSRIRAKKEGISIITQDPQVIPDYTVAENLFTPDYICSWNKIIDWKEIYLKAEQIINKNQINISSYEKVSDLSISEQQLLLVLKACYVDNAQIIIFDEVSSSLTKKDENILYNIIKQQKRKGKAIIFISHRMNEILEVCDRVTVLRDGVVIVTEERCNLNENRLSSFIVGKDYNYKKNKNEVEPNKENVNEIVLSVDNFTKFSVFQNITLKLKRGEIIGLAGLRGSGRTEIFKAIVGINPADEGWIKIGKEKSRFMNPSQALQSGIVYLPEDRDNEGLIDILSVRENLTLSSLSYLTKMGLINKDRERELTINFIKILSISTPSSEEEVKNLSGGNKQKVMLGKILATNPVVYLLDEPTKGIDISTKKDILKIIKEKLSKSAGVILTSPGLEDLILICDRILVLYKGKIIDEFSKKEFREADLYLAMQGMKKE